MNPPMLNQTSGSVFEYGLVEECHPMTLVKENVAPGNGSAIATELMAISSCGRALREDIIEFLDNDGAMEETTLTSRFVRSVYDSGIRKIGTYFTWLKTIASDFDASDVGHGLRKLLEYAEKVQNSLKEAMEELEEAIKTADWSLQWSSLEKADLVPTATPYELLHRFLLQRPEIMGPLNQTPATDDGAFLESLEKKKLLLSLASKKEKKSPPREPSHDPPADRPATSRVGDGRPSMNLSQIYRDTKGNAHIILGFNTPNYNGLPELSRVSREIRARRLSRYIPLSDRAFKALRELERTLLQEHGSVGDARLEAMAKMRSQASFLGGTNQLGMAMRIPSWNYNKACYLCASMMGYQNVDPKAPKAQTKKAQAEQKTRAEKRKYYASFD